MQTWTKETALPVIVQAYRERKLSAQNTQNGGAQCAYRGPAGPCVIGLLLDDETAIRFDRELDATGRGSQSLRFLLSGSITDPTEDQILARQIFPTDQNWFRELQNAHDGWIDAGADWEKKFCALIGIEPNGEAQQ